MPSICVLLRLSYKQTDTSKSRKILPIPSQISVQQKFSAFSKLIITDKTVNQSNSEAEKHLHH